jgi:hypothetical protein
LRISGFGAVIIAKVIGLAVIGAEGTSFATACPVETIMKPSAATALKNLHMFTHSLF